MGCPAAPEDPPVSALPAPCTPELPGVVDGVGCLVPFGSPILAPVPVGPTCGTLSPATLSPASAVDAPAPASAPAPGVASAVTFALAPASVVADDVAPIAAPAPVVSCTFVGGSCAAPWPPDDEDAAEDVRAASPVWAPAAAACSPDCGSIADAMWPSVARPPAPESPRVPDFAPVAGVPCRAWATRASSSSSAWSTLFRSP